MGQKKGSYVNQIGNRYAYFTVIEKTNRPSSTGVDLVIWVCQCECGKTFKLTTGHLKIQKSCGCKNREILGKLKRTHGLTKTKEYSSWQHMKSRCYNPNQKHFNHYGGRGINVCERWLNSFENFLQDMGKMPTDKKYTIDRIDYNGNYEPNNCKWSDNFEQSSNTRKNVYITHNGKSHTVSQWSRITGLGCKTISHRFARGYPTEIVLNIEKVKGQKAKVSSKQSV